MMLSDRMIKAARETSDIIIEPWDDHALGSNSYDVHLGETLTKYALTTPRVLQDSWVDEDGLHQTARVVLDAKKFHNLKQYKIGPEGFVLKPGTLYLGVTQEYTETRKYVPFVDGKSSIGRLGITIHCTAGRGDVGFAGHWTLEIHVVEPVRVYAGMPIAQLIYFETGEVDVSYAQKPGAKYNNHDPEPQASRMWMNFER